MIGQETIERVRQQTGVVALIGETVKLQKRGRAHVGLCPFHKEKTPSFHVNEERGFYHCFGCGAHGDAFRFVMEVEGLAFVEAIRRLAERAGIQIVETSSDAERKQQAEARRRSDELYGVGAAAAEFYERMLREHPLGRHAERELERRGLRTEDPVSPIADALQAFRVGYAPYAWDGLVKHVRDSGFSLQSAEQVGLLVPRKSGGGHYDRFRHRLMFAVLDLQGRVIAFSGRALDEPSDEELRVSGIERMGTSTEPPAKYLNSPESPVYKKREAVFGLYQARQSVRDTGQCVLVEGNFDVLSLHARGIKNVVAPLGTAFTLEQARQIKRFAPSVTLLFDADNAGRKAVLTAREAIREAGLTAKVGTLESGKDPDVVVRENGAEALARIIAAGQGIDEHAIALLLDSVWSAGDAHGRVEIVRQIAEVIASESDPGARASLEVYADQVAARLSSARSDTERLGLDGQKSFSALKSAVLRAVQNPAKAAPVRHEPPDRARSRVSRQQVERTILGALLDYPELFGAEEVVAGVDLVEGDVAGAIAALRQAWHQGDLQNPEVVLAKLSPSVHPFASARMAAPLHERIEDAQAEVLQNIEKLKRLGHKRRKSEVVEELERATKLGDLDQEVALLQEHMARARERHGL